MPLISNNRTLLPLRYVANALNIDLQYDINTRTATFTKGSDVVTVNIDSDTLYKNGVPYQMDASPMLVNSRALVSIANIAYAFGMTSGMIGDGNYNDIEWNAIHRTVTIYPDLASVKDDEGAMKYHVEK